MTNACNECLRNAPQAYLYPAKYTTKNRERRMNEKKREAIKFGNE